MEIVKFTKYPKIDTLSEIFQSLDIKFSLLNKDNEQVSMEGRCRDFLIDCLTSKILEHKISIYGMKYDFNENPYDEDNIRMSLHFPDLKNKKIFLEQIHFLNKLEKENGIETTKVFATKYKKYIILIGDKIYLSDSWKISFFGLMIKLLSYPNYGTEGYQLKSPEDEYYRVVAPHIETLFSLLHNEEYLFINEIITKFQEEVTDLKVHIGYKKGHVDYGVHNNAGVINFVKSLCSLSKVQE